MTIPGSGTIDILSFIQQLLLKLAVRSEPTLEILILSVHYQFLEFILAMRAPMILVNAQTSKNAQSVPAVQERQLEEMTCSKLTLI